MLKKLGAFFRPNGIIIFISLLFAFLMPVLYIYSEPDRTNYLPGEKQYSTVKSTQYVSIFKEYFFHTEGDIDVLYGIIERDYYANYIGIPLLFFYYLIASGINNLIQKTRHHLVQR